MQVIKKDGTKEPFNSQKIINAVEKSAERAMYHLTDNDKINILNFVDIATKEKSEVSINEMHVIVENALDTINSKVAKAYRDYRNYKIDFVNILDKVYQKSQALRYVGDVSNANTDSTLIATQRSLTYGQLNKEFEYIITNRDIDIDCIVNGRKRVRMATFTVDDIQNIEKYDANRHKTVKGSHVNVYFGCTPDDTAYAFYIKHPKKGHYILVITPNEKFKEALKKTVSYNLKKMI